MNRFSPDHRLKLLPGAPALAAEATAETVAADAGAAAGAELAAAWERYARDHGVILPDAVPYRP